VKPIDMDTEVETLQGGGASQPGIELYKFTVRATLNKAEALKASATAPASVPAAGGGGGGAAAR